MDKNSYYPVLFVYKDKTVKKIVNSQAPFKTIGDAIQYAYEADFNTDFEAGYAFWNGESWQSVTSESYEEMMSDNPDYVSRQDLLHMEANRRLDMEARGIW